MANKKKDQIATSDWNLQRLSTDEYAQHLAASISIRSNIAVFGRRGTGKTVIAKAMIRKAGAREIYLNLSTFERVDLGGYPNLLTSEEYVSFKLPSFYQALREGTAQQKTPRQKANEALEDIKKELTSTAQQCVLLLDEVDKADPSIWAPLLEIVQFKTINGMALPNLASVIMTGNLLEEGGSRPSPPLLDRTEKYIVEADVTQWLNWAGSGARIHPAVSSFIKDNPQHLFGGVDPEDRYADPSPRGWENASGILNALEDSHERGHRSEFLVNKVSGCVGKQAGIQFQMYYEYYQKLLPLVAQLFKGQSIMDEFDRLHPTEQLVTSFVICTRLATAMDDASTDVPQKDGKRQFLTESELESFWTKDASFPKGTTKARAEKLTKIRDQINYVGKFFSDKRVTRELCLISVRSQIQVDRLLGFSLDASPVWGPLIQETNAMLKASK